MYKGETFKLDFNGNASSIRNSNSRSSSSVCIEPSKGVISCTIKVKEDITINSCSIDKQANKAYCSRLRSPLYYLDGTTALVGTLVGKCNAAGSP